MLIGKIPRSYDGRQCVCPVTVIGGIGRIGFGSSPGYRDFDLADIRSRSRIGDNIVVTVKVTYSGI